MTLKQKQDYEANFNCIGYFLVDAFEKCNNRQKRKKLSKLMKNLNVMYSYTNQLETRLIKQKIQNEYIKESQRNS